GSGLLEPEGHRYLVTDLQGRARPSQHHVKTTRLEAHGLARRYVEAFHLLHRRATFRIDGRTMYGGFGDSTAGLQQNIVGVGAVADGEPNSGNIRVRRP